MGDEVGGFRVLVASKFGVLRDFIYLFLGVELFYWLIFFLSSSLYL
jgi:hypothetical protein